jgi:hypothetical protein
MMLPFLKGSYAKAFGGTRAGAPHSCVSMPLAQGYVVAADGNRHTLLAGIHDVTNRHYCNEL